MESPGGTRTVGRFPNELGERPPTDRPTPRDRIPHLLPRTCPCETVEQCVDDSLFVGLRDQRKNARQMHRRHQAATPEPPNPIDHVLPTSLIGWKTAAGRREYRREPPEPVAVAHGSLVNYLCDNCCVGGLTTIGFKTDREIEHVRPSRMKPAALLDRCNILDGHADQAGGSKILVHTAVNPCHGAVTQRLAATGPRLHKDADLTDRRPGITPSRKWLRPFAGQNRVAYFNLNRVAPADAGCHRPRQ
ncbi:hypothetical protein SKPI104516_12395 [Skermania piniformis]